MMGASVGQQPQQSSVLVEGHNPDNNGGAITIRTRFDQTAVEIFADHNGMGYFGAFDRQGKGRTLTPK